MLDSNSEVTQPIRTEDLVTGLDRKIQETSEKYSAYFEEKSQHMAILATARSMHGYDRDDFFIGQPAIYESMLADPENFLTPLQQAEFKEIENREIVPANKELNQTYCEQAIFYTRKDDILLLAAASGLRPKFLLHHLAEAWMKDPENECPFNNPHELRLLNTIFKEARRDPEYPLLGLSSELVLAQIGYLSPEQQISNLLTEKQIVTQLAEIKKHKARETEELTKNHHAHVQLIIKNLPGWKLTPEIFDRFSTHQLITVLDTYMSGDLTPQRLSEFITYVNSQNPINPLEDTRPNNLK